MSNLPVSMPDSDLTEKDMEKIRNFVAEGKPGLTKVTESTYTRMAEMYMSGASYWQISSVLGLPRAMIMYVSHTYSWYAAKQEYLVELQEKIKGRVIDAKLASQDFMLLMIQAYEKKIGAKLRKYLATDDAEHANEINLKEIDKLFKAVEMLQTLSGEKSSSKTPAVGLNVGDGVTLERTGDKLTITPKPAEATLGAFLAKMAEARRAEQNKKSDKDGEQANEEPKND